jgi:2-keto-4-pentenoate hydratase
MDPKSLRDAATSIVDASRAGKVIPSIARCDPTITLSEAYEIQGEQLRQRVRDGELVRGIKVALASVPAQRRMGIPEPLLGRLTDGMFHQEHLSLAATEFIQPKVEPALAFVLGRPLGEPGATVVDAIRAVEFVLPALDFADSRIEGWADSAVDMVADNACCGGVVLGGTPTLLSDVDLRLAGCLLYRNGELAATGAGGMALGSPINALVWLANKVVCADITVEPGHVVLVSSLTTAVAAAPGDTVTTSIAGVGSVTSRLSRVDRKNGRP